MAGVCAGEGEVVGGVEEAGGFSADLAVCGEEGGLGVGCVGREGEAVDGVASFGDEVEEAGWCSCDGLGLGWRAGHGL